MRDRLRRTSTNVGQRRLGPAAPLPVKTAHEQRVAARRSAANKIDAAEARLVDSGAGCDRADAVGYRSIRRTREPDLIQRRRRPAHSKEARESDRLVVSDT